MRSKRAAQHGCINCMAFAVVDTGRPNTVCGHVGILLPLSQAPSSGQSLMVLYRTCFWAGDTIAPKLRVRDGVPIQRSLIDAFSDMWETVVRAVGDLDSVLGFEVCLTSC